MNRLESRPNAVIGASGFVGQMVKESLGNSHATILSPSSQEVDITDIFSVESWLDEHNPRSVVLLAGWTRVKEAETERERCWRLNVNGTLNIASVTAERGIHLVYFSTGFVFINSPAKAPFRITDPIGAIDLEGPGVYEHTKKLAEVIIREVNPNHAIIRIDFPFGNLNSPKDLTLKILKAIDSGHPLIYDHFLTPSYLLDIALGLRKIIETHKNGTFQIACSNSVSPYEFGGYLCQILGITKTIGRISYAEYMSYPGRLLQTDSGGLDVSQTEQILGMKFHSWQSAVDEVAPKLKKKLLIR